MRSTPAKSGTGANQGLTVEYFDNDDLKGQPKLTRTERQGYLRWDMQDAAIVAAAPREHFSVRWSGELTVAQSGAYQLGFTRLECADCTGKDSASSIWTASYRLRRSRRSSGSPRRRWLRWI